MKIKLFVLAVVTMFLLAGCSDIKRLKDMENIAKSYNGVTKTYAIQAGRELRVIVGADQVAALNESIAAGEEVSLPFIMKV